MGTVIALMLAVLASIVGQVYGWTYGIAILAVAILIADKF